MFSTRAVHNGSLCLFGQRARAGCFLHRQLGGNGRALPSSDLCGGQRSVVSASAWFLVCVTGSAAMAEHCPPVIFVEGNAPSFPRRRGFLCVSRVRRQWQSSALQRSVWRETLRRFRVGVVSRVCHGFGGNGGALPSSDRALSRSARASRPAGSACPGKLSARP